MEYTPEILRKAEAAQQCLTELGAPLLPGGNWSANSLFEISGETAKNGPDGYPWADYYCMAAEPMEFGINRQMAKILAEHGLFAEWVNPGVAAVYPI